VRRPWLLAWVGGAGIGVANGVLRELTYGRRLSEPVAHQVSTATAIGAFAVYFAALQRRWPLRSRSEALGVGCAWVVMTVAFEFGFGRLVDKKPWPELLHDYNLARGRTWPLVLAWLAVGPEVTRRAR
jgi:hypothetical protein